MSIINSSFRVYRENEVIIEIQLEKRLLAITAKFLA